MIDMHRDMIFDWGLIKKFGLEKSINEIKLTTHKCDKTNTLDTDAVLEIVDLSFRYKGKSHNTLTHLNLKVMPGERVAITGHIGSGKSTLMKLILKMLYPTEGSIYLKKTCIYSIGTRSISDVSDSCHRTVCCSSVALWRTFCTTTEQHAKRM